MRGRKLKLIVAGEFYEDPAPYMKLIADYKLENEVVMFDRFINDNEVSSFFSVADIVVQPYRSATQSGVTQIAYHFRKPMIVTDVGGLREIVPDGKCGYVVNPDKDSIFDAIDNFYTNNRKAEFTQNVILESRKYSWSEMTASITEVYNKCRDYDYKK
jgi:glycosyltransferase involved in cell wall biosynthesis